MSDNTRNPNPRKLGDYEQGLDDDFDVPTYRRIADDGPAADAAPDSSETEVIARPVGGPDAVEGTSLDDGARPGGQPDPDTDPELAAEPHGVTDGTGAGPLAGAATGASAAAAAATSGREEAVDETPAEVDDNATRQIPRRDIYAAAGRAAPQTIEPLAKTDNYREADADFAEDAPTQAAPAATGYDDLDDGTTPGAVGSVGAAGLGAAGVAAASASTDDARTEYLDADDRDLYRDDARTTAYDDSRDDYATVGAAGVAGAGAGAVAIGDRDDDPDFRDDDDRHDRDLDPRRGTLDFGLLLLRLGVGGMLLMLGLATFFQFGGAPGLGALEATFADNGYKFAGVIAVAIPTVQVIAGGLLVLGLATPLGAALALAISAFLTMFEVAVGDAGWNILSEGAEPVRLQLMITAAALALQFTGPGRYGIDFSRGWARRPLASSWIFCILAVAAAIGLWYLTAGQIPFVDTTTGAAS